MSLTAYEESLVDALRATHHELADAIDLLERLVIWPAPPVRPVTTQQAKQLEDWNTARDRAASWATATVRDTHLRRRLELLHTAETLREVG